MSEFFNMGGYAGYVWSSYGIAAVAMIANVVFANNSHAQALAMVKRRIKREKVTT